MNSINDHSVVDPEFTLTRQQNQEPLKDKFKFYTAFPKCVSPQNSIFIAFNRSQDWVKYNIGVEGGNK